VKRFLIEAIEAFLIICVMALCLKACNGYAEQITEHRKVVAVVDTGINLNEPKLQPYMCNGLSHDFTGTGLQDTNGHGTNIAWNVIKGLNPQRFCLSILKYYQSDVNGNINLKNEIQAFHFAADHHAVLINFSAGGAQTSIEETVVVSRALNLGIIIVVAAGNDGRELDVDNYCYWPACSVIHPKFHVVGGLDQYGHKMIYSNYGKRITDWALGTLFLDLMAGQCRARVRRVRMRAIVF